MIPRTPERSELTPMQHYSVPARNFSLYVPRVCCDHQWMQQPLTISAKCATCGALCKRDQVSGRIVEYTHHIPTWGGADRG